MYTYELTPNLKTKSYRVLDNGVEIARSLAKKTAKVFCETYNQLLNQLETNHESLKSTSATNQSDSVSQEYTTSDRPNLGDNQIESCGDRERVSSERAEYFANALQQLSSTVNRGIQAADQCGRRAEEHGRRAEEHGRRAEEHGRRAEEHAANAFELSKLVDQLIELNGGVDPGDAELGAYLDIPHQLNHEAGSPTVVGQDDYLVYRTIDATVI